MSKELLNTKDLSVHFEQSTNAIEGIKRSLLGTERKIRAVDEVNLKLQTGEVQGVIGESGCGKSTLLETLLGLQKPTSGEVRFKGQPKSGLENENWSEFLREVQMIFQDPFNSLDPKYTISDTLDEQLKIYGREITKKKKEEVMQQVELKPPELYLDKYPDELSGGEKQRASIARALIVNPDILLADEPVSMLDVSTQASILKLLSDIVETQDVGMVYISHDISTVSYVCDSINVMYLGRIVESAAAEDLLEDPKHPYTQALIQAVPVPDPDSERPRVELKGEIPDPSNIPNGCRFKNRCPERMDVCDSEIDMLEPENEHYVACHLYDSMKMEMTPKQG
jgi:peptide/nickel transport system ATP-binding protein